MKEKKEIRKWKILLEGNRPIIYRKVGRKFLIPLKKEKGIKYLIKNED